MHPTATPSNSPPAGQSLSRQAQLRREQLLKAIDAVEVLPTSFVVPMRMLDLHRAGEADARAYADVLAYDPSLVSRVLALVNSAAFSPASPVHRPAQAVAMLGLRNLMPLVFGTSLAGIFNPATLPAADRRLLWRAAVLRAVAARELCVAARSEVAEEALVCALLQDIALPVVIATDRSMCGELLATLDVEDPCDRQSRELRLNGIDHAALSGRLARRLGLPERLCAAVELHHRPAAELAAALGDPVLAGALELAGELPHRMTQVNAPLARRLAWRLRTSPLGAAAAASPEAAEALVRRIGERYDQTLGRLGEDDENAIAYREFMQQLSREVTRCLHAAIDSHRAEVTGLESRQSQLVGQVQTLRQEVARSDYDPLTGILNRRGFEAHVARWVEVVRRERLAFGLGYVDLDDFKQINDKLGHAAGDAALVLVARSLASVVERRGIVARLGGDEFAFLVVPRGGQSCRDYGEALTAELARGEFASGEARGKVRASVGVLCLEAADAEIPLPQIMKRADELMYEVKRNGKGRCTFAGYHAPGARPARGAA